MPNLSRNARKAARTKRAATLKRRALKRQLFDAYTLSNKNFGLLLMTLWQSGGAFVIAADTIQAVAPKLASLAYSLEPGTDGSGLTIKMIDRSLPEPDVDVPAFVPAAGSVTAGLAQAAEAAEGDLTLREVPPTYGDVILKPVAITLEPADPTIAAEDPA